MWGQELRAVSLNPNAVLNDGLLSKPSHVGTQVKSLTGDPFPSVLRTDFLFCLCSVQSRLCGIGCFNNRTCYTGAFGQNEYGWETGNHGREPNIWTTAFIFSTGLLRRSDWVKAERGCIVLQWDSYSGNDSGNDVVELTETNKTVNQWLTLKLRTLRRWQDSLCLELAGCTRPLLDTKIITYC